MSVSSVCRNLLCCTSDRWKPKFKMELKLVRPNKFDEFMSVDVQLNVGEPLQDILHRILFNYHLFSKFDANSAAFAHQPQLNYQIDRNSCVDVNFKKVTVAVNEMEKTLKCIISCKVQLPDGETIYSNALLPHRSSIDMAVNDVIDRNGVPTELYNRYSAYRMRQDGSLKELDENCMVHHNGHYVIFMHNCPTALVTLLFNDQEINQKVFLDNYRTINDAVKFLVNRLEIYSYNVTNVKCNHKNGKENILYSLEHTMVDQGRYRVTIKECIIKIQVEVGAADSFVPTNLFVPAGISVDKMRHSLNSQATLEEDIMVYDKEYDTWILTMKDEKVKAENRYRLIVNEDSVSFLGFIEACGGFFCIFWLFTQGD
uniref:Uncharacterized protein n=1 Tax=Bursaphelenchus xylophilus TaxID=6326 RepID=A0A1I7RU07_BURXY